MSTLMYVAAPYTGTLSEQQTRADVVCYFAAELTRYGAVYSPITHGCALQRNLKRHQVDNHDFWMDQCMPVLRVADSLVLIPLPGWRISRGVQIELQHCADTDTPVWVLDSNYYNCEQISPDELKEKGWKCLSL